MRESTACSLLCLALLACDESGRPSDASAEGDATADAAGLDASVGGGVDAAPEPERECNIVAPTACEQPEPTYANVQPIFEERCIGCHSGEPGGPWPLTSYPHVAGWFAEIRAAMLTCAMPPADSGVSMPDAERDQVLAWLRCGYPP